MGGGNANISGMIVKGLGEGAVFMSMPHYKNEIKKKLGFDAYPGTLNVKVTKLQFDSLKNNIPIKINGFKKDGKIFGGANCHKSKIKNINGAIIMPDINKHKDIIEFIAPVHIKSKLKLADGDKVKIELIN
ncbi:MAG TPA: DUF120 domain-containing protein [Candidatus Nanoarchaeia archaeon]|nr:DUF120 domain-containing protein [Candidatus Nanoarchaeia archaeon]